MNIKLVAGIVHWPIYVRRDPGDRWQKTESVINLCPTNSNDRDHWQRLRDLRKASGFGALVEQAEMIVVPTGTSAQTTLADLAWGLTLSEPKP